MVSLTPSTYHLALLPPLHVNPLSPFWSTYQNFVLSPFIAPFVLSMTSSRPRRAMILLLTMTALLPLLLENLFQPFYPQKPTLAIKKNEEPLEHPSGTRSTHTRSRTEELIMSELRSLTRPNSVKGKACATSEHSSSEAGPFRGFTFTPEPLAGLDGWLSGQTTKELAQLRSDFTPRLFRGSSQKYHPTQGSSINSVCGKPNICSVSQPNVKVGVFSQESIVNQTPKSQ
ncbi:hypothetical protein DSO57_1009880 [Entomophthora muscae]|uniref:Uncharacterized protein n=1 Tax=Entomophthora muscae TaxID=34485 RepID=A0ACC2SJI1_9FUNG|nr:hypothetical protein DSO57_1009880 [Entomophthora muscae]